MKYEGIYERCSFCGVMLFNENNNIMVEDNRKFCNSKHAEYFKKNTPIEEIEPSDFSTFIPEKEKNRNEKSNNIDPITLSVINGAIGSICKEMGKTMQRTAFSPIFFEGNDFCCALFDNSLELIGQFEGNPAQLGSIKFAVGNAIRKMGIENLNDGDVIIHNDCYLGTPHLPEFCMIKPVFHEGKIIHFTAVIAHHPDVGGAAPGSFPSDATEVCQEGIFIRPQKMFIKGVENDAIWEIILSNVRIPHETYGDFMAMYGSLVSAEGRIYDLIKKYGKEEYLKYLKEIKKYSERMMREEISKIPNGIYSGIKMVDDDGISEKPYKIKLKIKVCDEDIIIDYREVDNSARGPINCTYGVGISGPLNAIFNILDPKLARNEGVFRPMHFITPAGNLLNAEHPSPVSGGNTETYNLIASAAMEALADAVPERVCAGCGDTTALITGGGFDERKNRGFAIVIWEPIGWGGRFKSDGDSAQITYCGLNARNYSTEVSETLYPLRSSCYKLRDGSGGEGKYRGGLGVTREWEICCKDISFGAHANRYKYPPEGLFGGGDGQRMEFKISTKEKDLYIEPIEYTNNIKSNTKFSGLTILKGQKVLVKSPGGAGYGNPKQRDKNMVIEDLKNGYITVEQAIKIYNISNKEVEDIINSYWFECSD